MLQSGSHRCDTSVAGLGSVIQRGDERFQPAGLTLSSAYGSEPAPRRGRSHELWQHDISACQQSFWRQKEGEEEVVRHVHISSAQSLTCRLSVTWCASRNQLRGAAASSQGTETRTKHFVSREVFFVCVCFCNRKEKNWKLKFTHAEVKAKVWPAQRCGVRCPQEGGVRLQGGRWGVQVSTVNGFCTVNLLTYTTGQLALTDS